MRGDAFIHFVCGSRRANIRLGVLLLIPKSPQMKDRKEIAKISWILTDVKITNSLRKKGVPSFKIFGFISEPKELTVY